MARQRSTIPAYQHHSSGRARVRTYDSAGKRVEIVLPGEYGSQESKQEYERILAQLRTGKGNLPVEKPVSDLTIVELVALFMEHAETYYVDPATKEPTSEIWALTSAFRPLTRLYGDMPAAEFDPLALKAVRESMIAGAWLTPEEKEHRKSVRRPIGLSRKTINMNVNRIKLLFRWAVENEVCPAVFHHALQAVPGLRRGRSAARETQAVKPISSAVIDDTLPHLPPIVKDMVEILLLTGMRVGELCIMRACDLDTTGDVWLYRPERHKGLWRDKERVIAIGPRAQEIIRKYLGMKIGAYLFTPAEQARIIAEDKRAKRKTPVQPSQQNRKQANQKRMPGERFEPGAVNRAIRRACERAGIEPWHVHQLRHSASLTFSRDMGLESARAALGHSSVDMSAMYAGRDLESAKKVAAKVG